MSDEQPSRIEDLPNELWLEIFCYLDYINLFSAFYGINKQINELLVSSKILSLYSSFFNFHSSSNYVFFKGFPIGDFKQLKHLKLIYDSPYTIALNVAKSLPSLSSLLSLTIHANFFNHQASNDLATIYLCQRYPCLQRLYLHGREFDREHPAMENLYTFYSPSLLYLHVDKLHYMTAIQVLEQCSQLRSFSAMIYGFPDKYSAETTTTTSIQLPTRSTKGLTALKALSVGESNDSRSDFSSTFLELLLPCCPNLRTFSFDVFCSQPVGKPLDPYWWSHALASNNKLKRISLTLRVFGALNIFSQEKLQRFQSLSLFAQLQVNITRTEERYEFPRLTYIYSIKN